MHTEQQRKSNQNVQGVERIIISTSFEQIHLL